MKFKINKIIYLKYRSYYLIMILIIVPITHLSIINDLTTLVIVEVIFLLGFLFDFIVKNIEIEFFEKSFTFCRSFGLIKILQKEVNYSSIMFVNLGLFSVWGNEYFNIIIRYRDFSKRLYVTRTVEFNCNYFDDNYIIEMLKIIVLNTQTKLRVNNKVMSMEQITEFKNNLSKAI